MRCICALRLFPEAGIVVVIFDLFKRMQEQSKAELATILIYHAAKSLNISCFTYEDLDENYGAFMILYTK